MVNGFDGQAAYELSPAPMIGLLPATTVVYILLGFGALLPAVLLSVVAITLCVRRRSRDSASDVTAVDAGLDGCHSNTAAFDFDVADDFGIDDVFWGETWTTQRDRETKPAAGDRGRDCRKRSADVASKAEIHSVDNPNVYFRNRLARTQSDGETRVCSADVGVSERTEKLSASSSYRNCEPKTPPPSCDVIPPGGDVTPTSSGQSDDAMSAERMSRDVLASSSSVVDEHVTTLDRVQSVTTSTLQQEEEQVLRSETQPCFV